MHLIFKALFFCTGLVYSMGTQMLVLPTSAEELSIGSHPTLSGLFSLNPALIKANKKHPYLSLNRGNWLGDVSVSQIGYNQMIDENIVHLGIRYSGISDLEFREEIPQDDPSSYFSAFGLTVDASTAFKYQNHKLGLSLSYVQFTIFNEYSRGISFDIGYAFEMKNNYILGIVAKDIGKMSKLDSKAPSLPNRLSAGISKKFQQNEYMNTIYGSLEWNSIPSTSKLYFGNHFKWNRLELLFGYATSNQTTETSFGVGLNLNRYRVTYGTRFGSQDIGFPKLLSFNIILP